MILHHDTSVFPPSVENIVLSTPGTQHQSRLERFEHSDVVLPVCNCINYVLRTHLPRPLHWHCWIEAVVGSSQLPSWSVLSDEDQ